MNYKNFIQEAQPGAKDYPGVQPELTNARKRRIQQGDKSKAVIAGTNAQPQTYSDAQRQQYTSALQQQASDMRGTTWDATDPSELGDEDLRKYTLARFAGDVQGQKTRQAATTDVSDRRKAIAAKLNTGQDSDLVPQGIKRSADQIADDGSNIKVVTNIKSSKPGKAPLSPEQEMAAGADDAENFDDPTDDPNFGTTQSLKKVFSDPNATGADMLTALENIKRRRDIVADKLDKAGEAAAILGIDSVTPGVEDEFDDATVESMLANHREDLVLGGPSSTSTTIGYRPDLLNSYGRSGAGIFSSGVANAEGVSKMLGAMADRDRGFGMNAQGKLTVSPRDRRNEDLFPMSKVPTWQDLQTYGVVDKSDLTPQAKSYMNDLADALEADDYEEVSRLTKPVKLPEDPAELQALRNQVKSQIDEKARLTLSNAGKVTAQKSGGFYGGDLTGFEGAEKARVPGSPEGVYDFNKLSPEAKAQAEENRIDAIIDTILQQGGGEGYNPMMGIDSFKNLDLEHLQPVSTGGWDEPMNWLVGNRNLNQAHADQNLVEYLRGRVSNAVKASDFYGKGGQNEKFRTNVKNYLDRARESDPDLDAKFEAAGIDPTKIGLTRATGEKHGENAFHLSQADSEEIKEFRQKLTDAGIPNHVIRAISPFSDASIGEEEYENLRLSGRNTESQNDRFDVWARDNEQQWKQDAISAGADPSDVEAFWNSETERIRGRTRYNLGDPNTEATRSYFDYTSLLPQEADIQDDDIDLDVEIDDDLFADDGAVDDTEITDMAAEFTDEDTDVDIATEDGIDPDTQSLIDRYKPSNTVLRNVLKKRGFEFDANNNIIL